jgi:hypothetical protein
LALCAGKELSSFQSLSRLAEIALELLTLQRGMLQPRRTNLLNTSKTSALAALLQVLALVDAQAQSGQTQMPMMGVQMTWPMIVGCAFILIVLALVVAAAIKYLFFR